ncbi:UPF0769 protein C21orf59 [Histomonas meleagridis]|uniref:UPF0769 protein C21orf59-like n=1 Tax=Histomonas meleagridis TaxID=135588 RepID=UPI003559AC28|nr:UPF0769 protein C21orf59 [Histomonas meleagridis]KAH0806002.1 UPF0769 protein C21orf59-like [Histomonas meleagridis]
MVIFHLQTTKETEFLYETTNDASISDVITEIAAIHNTILRIRCLVEYIKELIKSGPMGENDERSNPPENAGILERAISDAETAISPDQVTKKFNFTPSFMSEELARLSGAVSIIYPEGLPPTEPVRKVLEGADVSGEFDPQTCQLWWARKSLQRDKKVSDYLGNNSRTKAIAKLTDAKSGPPPREISMSKEAQIKMMSAMHKKAEELKRIQDDDDDSYMNSEWANPNGLKNTFQGLEQVDWKPH